MSSIPLSVFLSGAVIDLDGSLILQIALFFATFFLLRTFLFRPLLALFDAREAAIEGAKREARSIDGGADEKLKAFEAALKKVKQEAGAERESIRQDALRLERELLARAREEADVLVKDSFARLDTEAAAIRADSKKSVPVLAGQLAEKLLGRKVA